MERFPYLIPHFPCRKYAGKQQEKSLSAAAGRYSGTCQLEKNEMRTTSIVILSYNTLSYTKLCIESIRAYTKKSYEIIVVDNASTDGSLEWLKEQPDIKLIANRENAGFRLAAIRA